MSKKKQFLFVPEGLFEIKEFYHSFFWIEDDVIFGKYKPGLVINLEVAKEAVNDRKKISNGISKPFLIDITELVSVDAKARKYLASADGCEFLSAGAIYTHNKLLAFLGNAWILLDEPLIPVKVFTNKEAGLKWLEPFKYQN
ncbi:MAG: hypothetical protein Q8N66_18185 [Bacteroidota bacterium]|nr:hypothetical protein [Bacteroidota bacterium]